MLSKDTYIDQIEVKHNNTLQIREVVVISEDGSEISRSYFRKVLNEGDSLTEEDSKVQAVAAAVWVT